MDTFNFSLDIATKIENGSIFKSKEPIIDRRNINNIMNGAFVRHYPNGVIASIEYFKNGLLNDMCQYWYPDGSIKSTTIYSNGNRNGMEIEYFTNQQLYEYSMTYRVHVRPSQPFCIKHYKNNKLHGDILVFNEIGNTVETISFKDGRLISSKIL